MTWQIQRSGLGLAGDWRPKSCGQLIRVPLQQWTISHSVRYEQLVKIAGIIGVLLLVGDKDLPVAAAKW